MSGDNSGARRSELKRAYKEKPPPAGIFAVRNLENGKVLLGASMNVPGMLNRLRFELQLRMHKKWPQLQEDWDRLGPQRFAFEQLDVLEPSDDPARNLQDELEVLEALWLDRLSPYGDAGYNVRRRCGGDMDRKDFPIRKALGLLD